jgi:hypothetical protein
MEERDFIIEENGVYLNEVGNIVQIKHIEKEKNMILLYNISESCNMYLPHRENRFIKRIR